MPLIADLSIELDPEKIALAANHGRPNPMFAAGIAQAVEDARPLLEPRALFHWLEVRKVEGPQVTLAREDIDREVTLEMGPMAHLMQAAKRALGGVVTIGDRLEDEVRRRQDDGQMLTAFQLDSVGVVALGEVGRAARDLAEATAKELGWGLGPSLAPGSLVGWPTTQQGTLCSLYDLAEAQVVVNASNLIVPFKSASYLIGMGPDYPSQRVSFVCKWCALRQTCWRRKDDQE